IFDSANPTGGDDDLLTPGTGVGNDTALGNVLIISEDADSSDPDDNGGGGTIIFSFEQEVTVASVGILDIDVSEAADITAFDGDGNVITMTSADALGDNSAQTVTVDADGVRRLEIAFSSTGAVTSLDFECPDTICEDFDVDLMPIGSTTVPAEGGFIEFKVTVTNNDDNDVCPVQGWLIEELPNGNVQNPARGPIDITLAPGEMFMRTLKFRIGPGAQAGDYFCSGAIGLFPDVIARNGFVWTKLEGGGFRGTGSGGDIVLLDAATNLPVDDIDWLKAPVATSTATPQATSLGSYPNPFHSATTVEYTVTESSPVTLQVYDLTGRVVATLVEGLQEAGTHRVAFDGRDLAAGTYLYRLQVGDETRTHRVVLTK
ncbi:MAG: T9SS type A sorting domain-containing protein, partial [Bacteroidota bacterium]